MFTRDGADSRSLLAQYLSGAVQILTLDVVTASTLLVATAPAVLDEMLTARKKPTNLDDTWFHPRRLSILGSS